VAVAVGGDVLGLQPERSATGFFGVEGKGDADYAGQRTAAEIFDGAAEAD
jgi:hypothetical protein